MESLLKTLWRRLRFYLIDWGLIARRGIFYIRGSDTLIRYGGDEFLLIFSKIGEEVFYARLEQLRRAVQETKLPDYPEVKLDVSLGGVYRVHPLSEAIRQADLRMYENKAKHANVNHAACR